MFQYEEHAVRIVRSRFAILILMTLTSTAFADAPASTNDVQKFGSTVTEFKAVALAKLIKQPQRFAGQTVRIEGTVKDVCQGKGCWIEIQDAKGKTFIAKSMDESVLVPKDCKGQRVVVQGVFTSKTAKGHDAEHEASATPHDCPAPTWVLNTQGVELIAKQ